MRQARHWGVGIAAIGSNKSSPQRTQQLARAGGISLQQASQTGAGEIRGSKHPHRAQQEGRNAQLSA